MATETDNCCHDHGEYLKSWSFHELPSCKQPSVSEDLPISEILDHGSISFGRYATESLAWEKWSVFSHNRCQEELEKFKSPGLVAQKKAYFEEYYKKIRALKAMQADQQEKTAQPDSCQDTQSGSMREESNVNLMASQEEKKPSNVNESEQAAEKRESSDKPIMKDSAKKAFILRTLSSHSAKSTQKRSPVSHTCNNNANQLITKQASVLQPKGTGASIRNKTKLDSSRSTTNNVRQSAKPNPTLHRKSIHNDEKGRLTSKNRDPKAASSSRKVTEVRSSATVIKSPSTRDKLVLPLQSTRHLTSKNGDPKASNISNRKITEVPHGATAIKDSLARDKLVSGLSSTRARQLIPNTTSKGLAEKIQTWSSVHAQSAKLVSSSSTIGTCQVKRSTTSQGLTEKFPTRLSVHPRSAKSISEKTTVADGSSRNTALSKRSIDLMQKKSNQNIRVEFGQRSYVREGIQKEEKYTSLRRDSNAASSARLRKDSNAALGREPKTASSAGLRTASKHSSSASSAALGRDSNAASSARLRKDSNAALGREPKAASSAGLRTASKHSSSTVSNVPQAQNAKLYQKVVPHRSPDLIQGRRAPTQPRLQTEIYLAMKGKHMEG